MSEPEEFAVDDGSGPRKSFWGHLSDLRTALLRSAIAIGIALVACLLLDNKLVGILERPLHKMDMFEKPKPTVTLQIGDTKLGPYVVTAEQFSGLPEGTAPHVVFQVGTAKVGREQVLTLKQLPPDPTDTSSLKIRLQNFSPGEGFFVIFHVALYGALIVSSPFWLFFLGQFFIPALNLKERRVFFSWFGWGVLLFFAGVLLTYFVLLPVALRASVKYSEILGFDASMWRANEYISFVSKFIFGMGLGFQFPIVVLVLVKLGILTHAQLKKYRRHVVVLSLILGALLTTPEWITQVAMAIPLYILYEVCIWISWYWEWKKRRDLAVES